MAGFTRNINDILTYSIYAKMNISCIDLHHITRSQMLEFTWASSFRWLTYYRSKHCSFKLLLTNSIRNIVDAQLAWANRYVLLCFFGYNFIVKQADRFVFFMFLPVFICLYRERCRFLKRRTFRNSVPETRNWFKFAIFTKDAKIRFRTRETVHLQQIDRE